MATYAFEKSKFGDLVKALAGGFSVFGPVRAEDGVLRMAPADDPGKILFDFQNTTRSIKGFMQPQCEVMFDYPTDGERASILEEHPGPEADTLLFNVRPCDARGFWSNAECYDNPDNKNKDYYFQRRRDRVFLAGLGCAAPCPTCFCHATGGGPFSTVGLDWLMTDLGDRVLVEVLTDKGEQMAAAAGGLLGKPKKGEDKKAEDVHKTAMAKLPRGLKLGAPANREMMDIFESDIWPKIAETCINCGTCTYSCPTCTCFDILDEVVKGEGRRFRIWDACMYPLYTQHGSGHNPRPTKTERVRNRFMHKLKYNLIRHGTLSCVGCGRCVRLCPVNIDIREVAAMMGQVEPRSAQAQAG
jgi:sulfhydrogenase subunit beta (sulfur reductase)